jgi:MYXO-CTERM domain-containing protein
LCALTPLPPAFEACCLADTIVAAQPCVALGAGFVDWTVSFGDAIPSSEPSPEAGSPAPDAGTEDAGSCTAKTCDDYYSQNACGTQDNGCGGVLQCDCQVLAKSRCSATPGPGAAPDFGVGVGLLVLALVSWARARRRRR